MTPPSAAPAGPAAPAPAAGLTGWDPITAPDDPDLIAAALAYGRRIDADPEQALLWGRYAYQAAGRGWGSTHEVTIVAGQVYQDVLACQGLTFDAARVVKQRIAAYQQAGDPVQELFSRSAYAVALHRDGQCELAAEQTRIVLKQWRSSPYRYGDPATVLVSAAAVRAGCGQVNAAVELLHRDAPHLADMRPEDVRTAATWLAVVAATHPHWCGNTPPAPVPTGGFAEHYAFWLAALHHVVDTTITGEATGDFWQAAS
ncbi:hypothetical protein ACQPZJ_44715 [Actinoplanes sp. CA-054009]